MYLQIWLITAFQTESTMSCQKQCEETQESDSVSHYKSDIISKVMN